MVTQSSHAVPVRGTQSFVYTLSACWRRPLLTALEVAWRWVIGIPAAVLIWREATRILDETPLDVGALKRMSILDPMAAAHQIADDQFEGRGFVFDDDDRHSHGSTPRLNFYVSMK